MKDDKKTLIAIIVLLALFLPLSIYGVIEHKSGKKSNASGDNPNHEFIYNNKVYFYQENGELLNTYQCLEDCAVVEAIVDDDNYNVHYYKDGDKNLDGNINDDYVLFKDGADIMLYNKKLNKKIVSWLSVKDYSVEHTNPILITNNGGVASVVSLSDMRVIITDYDYIGIPNRVKDGVLDTSRFIAKNDNSWYVLEQDGTYKHTAFNDPIVDFNDRYIVVSNFDNNRIYSYDNQEYLGEIVNKKVYCVGDYIGVIIDDVLYLYQDLNGSVITNMKLDSYNEISFNINGNMIEVLLDKNHFQDINIG